MITGMKRAAVVVALATLMGVSGLYAAQGNVGWRAPQWAGTGKRPPPTADAAARGDVNTVVFNWMWYMGMIRGVDEIDAAAMFELRKASGTIRVAGQPCTLANYRASINYQVSGMRVQYTCTLPNGQMRRGIEVISGQGLASGQISWDEDVMGGGLVPGKGAPKPNPSARDERLIRLWAGAWGAPKSAILGGTSSKVAIEGGKPVVTFPIPGVRDATAKATLNSENHAERIEVRRGTNVTEFTYEKYDDYNPEDDRIQCYTPGHILEKQDGVTVLDLNVIETHCGNLYIVMPVPESVKQVSLQP
jgi:hypothetical protein